MAAKARTQADYRRDMNPRDQFGRKWLTTIELMTGEPTGGIVPAGWSDPLRTPMQYLKVPRNADGQSELGRLVLDFDAWIAEIEHAEMVWYQELHEIALAKYTALDPARVPELDKDKLLLKLVGPKPWPASDVLRTAAAGNQPLLGFTPLTQRERELLKIPTIADLKAGPMPAPTPANDAVIPETYKDFIAWAFRTGAATNLKEAAALWSEHKANLTAA